MSSSQHPVALRLERQVGSSGRLLATVMGLPLVDGIFPAVVLAGGLATPAGVLQVGLLIFGGSATLAVILAEMDCTTRQAARSVALVGTGVVALATVEAALAPTIASVLDLDVFKRFAALVIAAVAAKTASARVGELLPRPAVIVGLGLVASLRPGGAEFAVAADPALVARGAGAALVGVAFAMGVALAAPRLRRTVDVDRFRFGSAVALGLLPLSILGLPFGHAPLAVVGVTALLALDPAGDRTGPTGGESPVADDPTVTDGGPPVRVRSPPVRAVSDADHDAGSGVRSGSAPDLDQGSAPDRELDPESTPDPGHDSGSATTVDHGPDGADRDGPVDPGSDGADSDGDEDAKPDDDRDADPERDGDVGPSPDTTTTATGERAPWL